MASSTAHGPMQVVVERIAREAGVLALSHFRSDLAVTHKGHLDLVTRADREVESFLISRLQAAFPEDGIFGEEGGEIAGTSGRIWVIDPIDGTFNFVRGSQNWGISIGLFDRKRPAFGVIHAPARGLMLCGGGTVEAQINGRPLPRPPRLDMSQAALSLGMHPSVSTQDRLALMRYISDELRINFRFCGAATASLIEVALGETDGYISLGDSTWDVMAGLPILAKLGLGHTIDWDSTDLAAKLRFVCGSQGFIEAARPILADLGATYGNRP